MDKSIFDPDRWSGGLRVVSEPADVDVFPGISRRQFLALAATAAAATAVGSRGLLNQAKGGRLVLEGVDHYRVMEPMFEGVRVVLDYLGDKHTPAYVQGISGAAFRLAGICPCAPTCSMQMGTTDLIKLLGYDYTQHLLGWKDDNAGVKAKMKELIPKIKDSIRAKRPVLVWHAFTNAEWDVVAGFDDKEDLFLGRGSYLGLDDLAKAKQNRAQEAIEICPAFGGIIMGVKTGKFDANAAEVAALKEAVRHALDRGKHGAPDHEGLAAYDAWVDGFKISSTKRWAGDAYCVNIYRSTHRAAGAFLNEIAPKHVRAAEHLRNAAREFTAEADVLDKCEPMLGWKSPVADSDRNAKVWPLLVKARGHYAAGIGHIENALPLLS